MFNYGGKYYVTLVSIHFSRWLENFKCMNYTHNRFTTLFLGPPGSAGARRKLLDFMVHRKINRGRHTDHPAGRHSIQTKQCPPPPSSNTP